VVLVACVMYGSAVKETVAVNPELAGVRVYDWNKYPYPTTLTDHVPVPPVVSSVYVVPEEHVGLLSARTVGHVNLQTSGQREANSGHQLRCDVGAHSAD